MINSAKLRTAATAAITVVVASAPAFAQSSFYRVAPNEIVGGPGTVIREQAMMFGPEDASSYRVLYRSKGIHDEPIAVSGVVIVPHGPAPHDVRPVVAWAHPTTGVDPHCAPSVALSLFHQIQGLNEMLARGYVVVATDYPGLGTPGPHPYLVGTSEGRAVLDSVRAAREVPGVGPVRDFAVWGHSQGGQAALFTGLMAKTYAPDLHLVGVAAAAPATDLRALMSDDFDTAGGKNITAMTLWSWSQVFDLPLDQLVTPAAMPTVERLSRQCIESVFDLIIRRQEEKPLETSFLTVDNISSIEPWRSLLAQNTPGVLPRDVPVFLVQGTTDNVVVPKVTYEYTHRLCEAGSSVRLVTLPGVGHAFIARDAAPAAIDWMANRFTGLPAPNDCNRQIAGE